MTESRKSEIQEIVESAVRSSNVHHICFGHGWTKEDQDYAVHYGQNFGLKIDGGKVYCPAGMRK